MACAIALIHSGLHVPWHPACHPTTPPLPSSAAMPYLRPMPDIITVPLSRLKPNPANPRVLRDDKFAKLRKSIQDFPDMLNYRATASVPVIPSITRG